MGIYLLPYADCISVCGVREVFIGMSVLRQSRLLILIVNCLAIKIGLCLGKQREREYYRRGVMNFLLIVYYATLTTVY